MKRLVREARLPIFSDFYENVWENWDFKYEGIKEVKVDDIIGGHSGRVDEYNNDWTPKNPDDPRWIYQKNLVESGKEMQPIPVIEMPNGKLLLNGDGQHRASIAKVLNLDTVKAEVSKMVPLEEE